MKTRRDFLRALLAACVSTFPYSSAAGQQLLSDNAFQAKLSHLYTRDGGQLRQILIVDAPGSLPDASIGISIGKRFERVNLRQVRKIYDQYYVPITPVEQKETANLALRNAGRTLETSLEVRPIRR